MINIKLLMLLLEAIMCIVWANEEVCGDSPSD